jgi:hypothetical protein
VRLSDITVNIEGTPGSMNYDAILDKLKSAGGQGTKDTQGTKFIIRELELKNIRANVTVGPLATVTVPVDRIVLKDVGKDGLNAGEVTQVVVQSILQAVASNGGGLLPESMLGDMTRGLSSLKDLGIESLNGVQKQLESTFGGFIEGVDKEVKGFFDSILSGEKKKDGK